ncbi:MAG: hypothetical protein AAGE96_16705 [Cyanobacteria bacterium P01_G01_bin.19]
MVRIGGIVKIRQKTLRYKGRRQKFTGLEEACTSTKPLPSSKTGLQRLPPQRLLPQAMARERRSLRDEVRRNLLPSALCPLPSAFEAEASVKTAERVKSQLQHGINPQEVDSLKALMIKSLHTIDRICADNPVGSSYFFTKIKIVCYFGVKS